MTANPNIDPVTGQPIASVNPADLSAHSEQALIEMVYIKTANDLLGSALVNLQSALGTTQSVLNILQALQNLHNDISVKSKSAFGFNYSTGFYNGKSITASGGSVIALSTYVTQYNQAASAYFGKAIDPFFAFKPTDQGYQSYVNSLTTLKSRLETELQVLQKLTPVADQDPNSNSLYSTVKKVLGEMPSTFTFNAINAWVTDNLTASGNAAESGKIQNDLTSAITAASSLNDTQKEQVRRFLYIFQEYYQSAAAVLSKISQIVEQMAQKITQ